MCLSVILLIDFKVQMSSIVAGYSMAFFNCGHAPSLFRNGQGDTLRRSGTTNICIIHEQKRWNDSFT